ncbi:MAG: UDP-3-O-(3-hydroxymyristoyl)glucosamine N-acyltransferase [Chitinophagales bacterium]
MKFTAGQIAALVGGTVEGDQHYAVTGIAKVESATALELSFIANPKYEQYANTTKAGLLLTDQQLTVKNDAVKAVIRVDDPYGAFTKLLQVYQDMLQQQRSEGIEQPSFIHPSVQYGEGFFLAAFAYVGPDCRLGKYVTIHPHVSLGRGVQIGDHSIIHAGARIYDGCIIGSGCIIHAGAVIGGDGFGFAPTADGRFQKIPQTGIVVLGDDVEIGANTVVDRATIGQTVVGNGVKLDNLVHIAHNVEVGDHSVIAAQTGISGSTKLGKRVMIGGQAGLVGHIQIADGVKINAQSGVSKSITEENTAVSGSPAAAFREHYKQLAYLRQLPELFQWAKKIAAEK